MAWETRVHTQVESYQRLKKWYLMQLCFTLSNRSNVSRVKWSNPENGVAPSPTPQYSSYWKKELSAHPQLMSANLLNIVSRNYFYLILFIFMQKVTGVQSTISSELNYHNQKIRRTLVHDILERIKNTHLPLRSLVRSPALRSRYTLLMRPNKVETAVQSFRMSCVSVHRIFWSWEFNSQYNSSTKKKRKIYTYILALEVKIITRMRISNPLGKMWPWRWPCPL